jgi:menaquinone-dependent protoporphyrinogen oxidase
MMVAKRVSRREFLRLATIAVGGIALAGTGLACAPIKTPEVEPLDHHHGEENPMNERILVTYATMSGTTAQIAAAVADTLASRGFSVDVKPVKENPSLQGYQYVVIGSAVRCSKWLGEAVKFASKNQAQLNSIPVALFSAHLWNLGEDETSRAAREAYTAELRQLLPGAQEAFFAGAIDLAKLSFFDRMGLQAGAKDAGISLDDHRDWDQIRAWANAIFA